MIKIVKVTPTEYANKWARRLRGAVDDIRAGVEKLDKNPAELAIAKKEKFRARILEAIDKGIWERRLKQVTLDDWKKKFLAKGLPAISRGVEEAIPDMEAFGAKLLPHIEAGQKKVAELPDLTLEDSIRRAETFIRHMAQFKYK